MPITLGSNIASLTAQRRLAEGTSQLSKAYERLSSGMRINRASDDAAGLAISDSLRADSRIFNQGVRNLNDGISLLNIADSAVENLSSVVVRLSELAEQAANGTYSITQRKAIDAEAQALSREYFRISQTTTFNGQQLLNGSLGSVNLQAGYGTNSVLSGGVGGNIGDGTFGNAVSFAAGVRPIGVTTGDFNGDGFQDIVTSNTHTSSNVQVLLGNGVGGFAQASSFFAGGAHNEVVASDFTGDGILDIAAISSLGSVNILKGAGNGTFTHVASYGTGGNTQGAKAGDLNGDGIMDLVTVNYAASNNVNVYIGTGGGTFAAAVSYASGTNLRDVELTDMNNDGVLDIVTADTGSGQISIYSGRGDGIFAARQSYFFNPGPYNLATGDFNSDGFMDIATGNHGANNVSVRFGSASGTFSTTISFNAGTGGVGALMAGDFNGDGKLDLIAANAYSNSINVLIGNGAGSFNTALSFGGAASQRDMAVADFNSDGVLDVVTTNYDISNGAAFVLTGNTKDGVAPLLQFSLKTAAGARQALPMFQQKLTQLAAQRGEIGAYQSRIQVAANVLQVTSENYKAAESRIRDADIAAEAADLTRLKILQQASAAILAQANQQPSLALRLLGGNQ